ncbi:Pentatricopeptide repeat [Dillenia turbinata]|uniref:Pentatricopeptide repeat n=1 Tax=Dillenia turbinata TaxID=194707 RepID=A0AAN8VHB9_9MAGN
MIAGYVQNDCSEEGLILFNRMSGKWVHGCAIKRGIDFNSCLVTTLVDMYVKCAVIKDAHSVFYELSCIVLVSWTAMIVGYSQSGHPTEALKLFIKGKCDGCLPNSTTLEIEDNAVGNALVDMF